MITPPSSEFTTAASAAIRKPKIRLDVTWNDPTVQSGNTVTSSYKNTYGGVDSEVIEDFLLHTVDTVTVTPHKYIINDGSFINDGTFYPIPGTVEEAAYNQVGWYTSGVSDSSGDFTTPQQLIVTFPENRTIKRIVIVGYLPVGYSAFEEYPTDFDIQIYDATDTLLNTTTNFTGTSVQTIADFTSDDITTAKYMVLTLNSWSEPGTIGKIVEFFGVVSDSYTGDDIVSMDILEEMESDDGSVFGCMSSNEMDIELQNISIVKDGATIEDPFLPENTESYLNNSIDENARMEPYIGFQLPDTSVEYVEMGIMWTTPNWDVSQSKFSASGSARDRMEILRKNNFVADEILESTNLKEVAEYVMNYAKVYIPLPDLEWDISSDLESFTVDYAWIGRVTYFEALKQIALACFGRCYSDRSGKIVIESYLSDNVSGYPVATITSDDYFDINRPMREIRNYISVPVCPFKPESEADDIYTSDDIIVNSTDTLIDVDIDLGDILVYEYISIVVETSNNNNKPTYKSHPTENKSGLNTFKIQGKIPSATLQVGIIKVKDNTEGTEQSYAYTSWSESTFNLSTSLSRDYNDEDEMYVDYTYNITMTWEFTEKKYYKFKARFKKIYGTSGTFTYKIIGKKLLPTEGNAPAISYDQDSINLHQKQEEELSENYLIQSSSIAQTIADAILLSLNDRGRDIEIEVQGNPCYELGDIISVETYKKLSVYEEFRIIRQQFKCDRDGMRVKITGRKTVAYSGSS